MINLLIELFKTLCNTQQPRYFEVSYMATATLNGNQVVIPGVDLADESTEVSNKPRKGNALMKRLEPEFLSNPQPLEFAEGMMSDEFCFEKTCRTILEPLAFETEKEWVAFAKLAWHWQQQAETREKEAIALQVLHQIESDPKVLEILKEKLLKLAS